MSAATWEVFDPRDGRPVFRSRFRVVARFVAARGGRDYARTGSGWIR